VTAQASLLVPLVAAVALAAQIEPGNRAYRRGDGARALDAYRHAVEKRPDDPAARYNLGTVLLLERRPGDAAPQLARAVEASNTELRARAFYNLGNTYLARALEGDREAARNAIAAYREALLLRPRDPDAKWNLELALRQSEQAERPPTPSPDGAQQESETAPQDGPPQDGPAGAGDAPPQPAPPRPAAPDLRPLSRASAEQILNAIEEQERALQREKLRRQQVAGRPTGPDW
jgi:tetratricopeptide (TPR) repeat protein